MPLLDATPSLARPVPEAARASAVLTVLLADRLAPIWGVTASAVLLYLAAPGLGDLPSLAFLAFWPWFASLRRLSPLKSALSGLCMGLAYIIPGRWATFAHALSASGIDGGAVSGWNLLFFLSYALPFALFAGLDGYRRRHFALSPSAGALWQAASLATLVCGLWSPFAYTPASFLVDFAPLPPLAALLGEVLLLLLLLWPAAALATVGPRLGLTQLAVLLPPLLAISVASAWGQARIWMDDRAQLAGEGQRLAAMTLQLDLPPLASPRLLDRRRPGAAVSAAELSRLGLEQAPACEFVIWPEVPVDPAAVERSCSMGNALADWLGRPLLAQCYQPGVAARQITATWFPGKDQEPKVHAKSALVPGYERPLRGSGPVEAGRAGVPIALDGERRVLPTLCYELHSGPRVREGVLGGAQFIVHMASFTPFGRSPIDRFDLGMTRLRAAEYARPILRAANRGSSGWIDALGRSGSLDPPLASTARCQQAWAPNRSPTPYARIGPLAAWIPGLLALCLLPLAPGTAGGTRSDR